MSFRVGQKVVCVNDIARPGHDWMDGDRPTVGDVYVIIGFESWYGVDCIFTSAFPHWSFDAARFRPAVERKTDISIFAEMLISDKPKVRA